MDEGEKMVDGKGSFKMFSFEKRIFGNQKANHLEGLIVVPEEQSI
jgi:hypothetical protein